jgi:CheY-like chemotaxis protein
LNNAAKYTPQGGRIALSAEREGNDAVIRVRDNGFGLAPEMLPQLFELFTQVGKTLEHSQGGLGIGLALAKRLVEMHGGNIEAHSQGPGEGSTFIVRLPLAQAHGNEGQKSGEEASRPDRTGSLRILVVDDNVDGAEMLAMLLTLTGHVTETVHTGAAALEAARTFQPQIVLLDIGLPLMNGYEVAGRLRSDPAMKGLILVAVTGWGTENDRRRAQEAGFDHHLTKPVQIQKLQELITEIQETANVHRNPQQADRAESSKMSELDQGNQGK